MLSKVKSCGLMGIDGYIVEVETDISNGIPQFEIVGLGDAAVKESKERVRAAIRNSGLEFPIRRITINLAPAHLKKAGSALDLAIAMGILTATGQIQAPEIERTLFVGELSLDGEVKPVKGILSMAVCARDAGVEFLVLPRANAEEAAVVKGIRVLPILHISEIISHFSRDVPIEPYCIDLDYLFQKTEEYDVDFADVKGQENVKRALEVAASGAHNLLMMGSPGAGKTMLAQRLPTILPSMSFEEALEVTKIHSIAGLLPARTPLVTTRPFRSPHHTISSWGLVGGGRIPKPGEISLAHYGVLFMDELPEFGTDALEVLRQPLEDGVVTISRLHASLAYPAETTLVCAANPCKCGNYLEPDKACSCSPRQIQQYLGRISAPLMDRLDIQIEVSSVKYSEMQEGKTGEKSRVIRERVNKARKVQLERYKGLKIFSNSQLSPSQIRVFCRLDEKGRVLMRGAYEKLGLSARAHDRILKVARTIADMDGSDEINPLHLAEAIQYRSLDRRFKEN